jgi:methyl-accepting chemotaxis protein
MPTKSPAPKRSSTSASRPRRPAVTAPAPVADHSEFEAVFAEYEAQVNAISRSMAVIEFDLDGTVLTANDNFLTCVGYTLEEVRGKHHSMFCDPAYASSPEYREFWAKLNRGEFMSGEFARIGKGGREIFIQATYNALRDADGRTTKVIKFANDLTTMVKARREASLFVPMVESAAINLMRCDLDFTITYLNPASLATLKRIEEYLPVRASEVKGSLIDIFHKDPAHQRRILSNDRNLPHRAIIKLGPETLDLNAVAIYDEDGKYAGPMVNWSIITDQVQMADEFEASIMKIANVVSSSSTELEASAQGMAASSEETTRQAQAVAAASEQATRNVEPGNRAGGQGHHQHCAADEPARAECHDRGRARW